MPVEEMNDYMENHVVIMAGGIGSRFWPMSTPDMPKQFVDLLGMPEEEFPFYDSSQKGKVGKIVRRVLDEGNFGKERSIYKNRGTNYLLNKTRSLWGHLSKTSALLFLFPKPTMIQFGNTLANGFSAVWTDFRLKFSGKKREGNQN